MKDAELCVTLLQETTYSLTICLYLLNARLAVNTL